MVRAMSPKPDTTDPEIRTILPSQPNDWEAAMAIYRATFPDWEREPEDRIAEMAEAGRYVIRGAYSSDRIKALSMLDLDRDHTPPYVLLNFLATDEQARGQGLGASLLTDASDIFRDRSGADWLITEAEAGPAGFYAANGFFHVDIEYLCPSFIDETSVPMSLMVVPRVPATSSIPRDTLKSLIARVYTSGYGLSPDDPRLKQQLERITRDAALVTAKPATGPANAQT